MPVIGFRAKTFPELLPLPPTRATEKKNNLIIKLFLKSL
jgi:hypothetical protein